MLLPAGSMHLLVIQMGSVYVAWWPRGLSSELALVRELLFFTLCDPLIQTWASLSARRIVVAD